MVLHLNHTAPYVKSEIITTEPICMTLNNAAECPNMAGGDAPNGNYV